MTRATKQRCLNLRPWQSRALAAGATQLWVPMKPQPVGGDRIIWDEGRSVWIMGRLRDSENAWRDLRCPYPPGCVIVGRETWCSEPGGTVHYRADGWEYGDGAGGWKSPSTMPTALSRWHLPVVSCRPVRVWEASHRDIAAMGFELVGNYRSHFLEQWQADYGTRHSWESAWAWRVEVTR